MTSRTNIRSRLTSQKEDKERLGWRTSSINRGEERTPITTFQRSASVYRSGIRSDLRPDSSTPSFLNHDTTADNKNNVWDNREQLPRLETLISYETPKPVDWRGRFNIKTDLPSKEEISPTDHHAKYSFLVGNTSNSFHRNISASISEKDSFCEDNNERINGSIFESRRFQSLRTKKQKDLDLLSQRYKQNQEDWRRPTPERNYGISIHTTENGVHSTNGTEHLQKLEESGIEQLTNDCQITPNSQLNDEDRSFSRRSKHTLQTTPEMSVFESNLEFCNPSKKYSVNCIQPRETHFDSNHNNYNSNRVELSPQSSCDRKSWIENQQDQHDIDDYSSMYNGQTTNNRNNKTKSERDSDYDDRSFYEEDNSAMESFSRGNSKRSSKQQVGFRGAVQGFLARIGRKIGKNDTPKLTKDEKIIAIMLQRREQEEREELEKEEAHARWEAEKEDMQRNSTGRRSIDPGVFRRRNSLGGSVSGMKRDTSKSRPQNMEKHVERKKQQDLQMEEQKQQLQVKMESDFQRASSLRASISQQNLLKTKLKNLQMEQKQQQISQQKRKSMENLSQLKKQMECKHIMAEQKLENIRKEQRRSRDDLRCKAEQSKLKLQQLNEELAQYQAELQEFNDKQLQHADNLVRRVQAEKREAARRERLEKEKALLDNKRRIQEEEEKKQLEKEEQLKIKERKREQLVQEKLEMQAKSRASARASQMLREEIRNSDDLSLTAKRLTALQEKSFLSKRSSDTDSLNSAVTSPTYHTPTQRTKM